MSFSSECKNEICHLPLESSSHALAELCGLVYAAGSISLDHAGMHLLVQSENNAVCRRLLALAKECGEYPFQISVKTASLKKKDLFVATLSGFESVQKLFHTIGFQILGGLSMDPLRFSQITRSKACRIAFLRGCFLGCGSMINPQKTYHLEFLFHRQEISQAAWNILKSLKINAKCAMRKDSYFLYLKDVESITMFLASIGAYSSVLALENIRIYKEIRNNVNRQTNFDQANIDRTVRSALKQIENIQKIDAEIGLHQLSPKLQEAAFLRLEHPEASLSELTQLCPGCTRSGMNHRLRKLNEMAKHLVKENRDAIQTNHHPS